MTLTCTHSFFVPRHVRAVVAVQSLVVIARVGLVAHLAHLAGAGLAAVAPVHEEAHPQRARRGDAGTLAGPLAVLRAVVRLWRRGRDGRDGGGGGHGSGILGEGLERGKKREALVRKDVFPEECKSLITRALQNNKVVVWAIFSMLFTHNHSHSLLLRLYAATRQKSQEVCQDEQSSITVLSFPNSTAISFSEINHPL